MIGQNDTVGWQNKGSAVRDLSRDYYLLQALQGCWLGKLMVWVVELVVWEVAVELSVRAEVAVELSVVAEVVAGVLPSEVEFVRRDHTYTRAR